MQVFFRHVSVFNLTSSRVRSTSCCMAHAQVDPAAKILAAKVLHRARFDVQAKARLYTQAFLNDAEEGTPAAAERLAGTERDLDHAAEEMVTALRQYQRIA